MECYEYDVTPKLLLPKNLKKFFKKNYWVILLMYSCALSVNIFFIIAQVYLPSILITYELFKILLKERKKEQEIREELRNNSPFWRLKKFGGYI